MCRFSQSNLMPAIFRTEILVRGVGPHHKHKSWGLTRKGTAFSTAEETAYPMKLAFHIAFFIAQHVVSIGWSPPMGKLAMPDEHSSHVFDQSQESSPNPTNCHPWCQNLQLFLMSKLNAVSVLLLHRVKSIITLAEHPCWCMPP